MTFGKYRLIGEIGSGGMATVHRAMLAGPEGFELELVIKRIRGDFSEMTSNSLAMLLTEARISAKLRHPSIVQVYELGEVSGEFYLAMELVDGWDLRRVLEACQQRQRPIAPGVACFIVSQVASALAYAHSLKEVDGRPLAILHRDISPSNVMVTPAGGVKLLDFGIAKVADHLRRDTPETAEHTVKGKVVYMSPEQTRGLPLDGRSDLFSLGIVFYELLTGQRPFSGATTMDTMMAICQGAVVPPSKLAPSIPRDLDALVAKMLSPQPVDRHPNGVEVFHALTRLTRKLHGDAASLQATLEELGITSGANIEPKGVATAVDPTPSEQLFKRVEAPKPNVASVQPATIRGPSEPVATDIGAGIYRSSTHGTSRLRTGRSQIVKRRPQAALHRRVWPLVAVAAVAGLIGGIALWSRGAAHGLAERLAAAMPLSPPAKAAPKASTVAADEPPAAPRANLAAPARPADATARRPAHRERQATP